MTKNHAIATESWEAAWAEDLACFSGRAARATEAALSHGGISPQMLRETDVADGPGESKALKICRVLSRDGRAAALAGAVRRSTERRDHGFDDARKTLLFFIVAMLALISLVAPVRGDEGPAATAPTTVNHSKPWTGTSYWTGASYFVWPVERPQDGLTWVHEPQQTAAELESSRAALTKGRAFGELTDYLSLGENRSRLARNSRTVR